MVLIVAIIGMIIIMVRERNRVLVIETEAQTIHRVQHNGNIVQHHITILSTYGETALSWEEEDFANYHSLRLHIDSMLQAMHKGYEEFVSQSQIDSLRYLLSSKEEHLYQLCNFSIVRTVRKVCNSLIYQRKLNRVLLFVKRKVLQDF